MDEPKQLKDHKQIGQEQELFFTHEIAPGAPFWLPKGMVIFKELEKYIRELTEKAGYLETSTPIMVKSKLFKKSGHWSKFGSQNMYNLPVWETLEEIGEITSMIEDQLEKLQPGTYRDHKVSFDYHGENLEAFVTEAIVSTTSDVDSNVKIKGVFLPFNYTLKPMNCPESTILYGFRQRSYKELPLRLAEIGKLHRWEQSGEVNGLLRVRQLTMDDAHIYCVHDQIFNEVSNILDMMDEFYKSFGLQYELRFATRPENRAGTDTMWDKAEKDLADVLTKKGIKAGDKKGDGAFYGPKIDLHIKDALGREWQLATVQLDFHQPEAFKLAFIDADGKRQRPVMIHRAIFGSFERFIGIMTEHYQGAFPVWLSPVQVVLIPIADRHQKAVGKIKDELLKHDIRVEVNDKAETMQAKIRDATLQKVPYIGIIGDKEIGSDESLRVSLRLRSGEDEGLVPLSQLVQKVKKDIDKKA